MPLLVSLLRRWTPDLGNSGARVDLFRRGRLGGAALAVWLSLCGGAVSSGCDGSTSGSATPSDADGRAGRNTKTRGIKEIHAGVRPGNAAVERYGAPVDHPLTEGEALLETRLSALGLVHDPSLSRMIRSLAELTPTRFDMPPRLVDGLLAWNGITDPSPSVVVVELATDPDACGLRGDGPCAEVHEALLESVAAGIGDRKHLRFGVGVSSPPTGPTRLMVGVVERGIELDVMPAALAVGAKLQLRGHLLGGRSNPRVEVIDARGKHMVVPAVVGDDGSVAATVICGGRGRHKVEVLADGRHGPEIVANFPLECGTTRSPEIEFSYERLSDSVVAADVARANFVDLNEAREARGIPALVWDGAVAEIAIAHSRDMVGSGFMGHVSPTTGDVVDRFARARLKGVVIRENVARGYGPYGIHESLMNSPGHRVNMLAADVTHVGIGVVFSEPETDAVGAPRPVFLTQNFFSRADATVPKDLARKLRALIDGGRKRAGLSTLRWDRRASALAQERADALASGSAALPDEELSEALFGMGFTEIDRRRVEATLWKALATLDMWGQDVGPRLGVGVAARSEVRGGGFVMVLLIDAKR